MISHTDHNQLQVYQILDTILTVESWENILKLVEAIFQAKDTAQILEFAHKQFEYCNSKTADQILAQPKFLQLLAKETFKVTFVFS